MVKNALAEVVFTRKWVISGWFQMVSCCLTEKYLRNGPPINGGLVGGGRLCNVLDARARVTFRMVFMVGVSHSLSRYWRFLKVGCMTRSVQKW